MYVQVLVIAFQEFNRRKGMVTSGLIFLFWLLLAVCGAFQMRTLIQSTYNEDDRIEVG